MMRQIPQPITRKLEEMEIEPSLVAAELSLRSPTVT